MIEDIWGRGPNGTWTVLWRLMSLLPIETETYHDVGLATDHLWKDNYGQGGKQHRKLSALHKDHLQRCHFQFRGLILYALPTLQQACKSDYQTQSWDHSYSDDRWTQAKERSRARHRCSNPCTLFAANHSSRDESCGRHHRYIHITKHLEVWKQKGATY